MQLKTKRKLIFLCESCETGFWKIPEFLNSLKDAEKRIETLEKNVDNLQATIVKLKSCGENMEKPVEAVSNANTSNGISHEGIMTEIEERKKRSNNLIFFNIPEVAASTTEHKIIKDTSTVRNILTKIIPNSDISIQKVIRIGKVTNKPRPVRVVMQDPMIIKQVLRNRNLNPEPAIKISADLTIAQRKFLNDVRKQLEERKAKGEADITIKYVQGVPKIVSTNINKRKN